MSKRISSSLRVVLLVVALVLVQTCGDKNSTGPEKSKVTCEGGCSSMSWAVKGETGSQTINATCNRTYTAGGNYVETCTGSITYSGSGKTYKYSATYDWPNCKITVNVTGAGSCSDAASSSSLASSGTADECHCEGVAPEDLIVRYKE